MTARMLPDMAVPDGYEWHVVADPDWRLVAGKPCRFTVGPGHKACGAPSVAELKRGSRRSDNWWAYCPDHLYGHWIEDGQVYGWRLREIVEAPDA